jgi:hypothetical protein
MCISAMVAIRPVVNLGCKGVKMVLAEVCGWILQHMCIHQQFSTLSNYKVTLDNRDRVP